MCKIVIECLLHCVTSLVLNQDIVIMTSPYTISYSPITYSILSAGTIPGCDATSNARSVKSAVWNSPNDTGADLRELLRTRHTRTLSRPQDTILY